MINKADNVINEFTLPDGSVVGVVYVGNLKEWQVRHVAIVKMELVEKERISPFNDHTAALMEYYRLIGRHMVATRDLAR